MKKKFSFTVLASLMALGICGDTMPLASAGSEGSGGGNDSGMDFEVHAKLAIQEFEQMGLAARHSISASTLRRWLDDSQVIVVSKWPIEGQSGFDQESIVVNIPAEKRIEVFGFEWDQIQDRVRKKGLALHELLSMAGLEKTGDYSYSSEYESLANSAYFSVQASDVIGCERFYSVTVGDVVVGTPNRHDYILTVNGKSVEERNFKVCGSAKIELTVQGRGDRDLQIWWALLRFDDGSRRRVRRVSGHYFGRGYGTSGKMTADKWAGQPE